MALIEVHADLGRCAAALERIANAIEALLPPVPLPTGNYRKAGLDALTVISDEERAEREEEEERRAAALGYVPHSEAGQEYMVDPLLTPQRLPK